LNFLKSLLLIAALSLASLTNANPASAQVINPQESHAKITGIYASRGLSDAERAKYRLDSPTFENKITKQAFGLTSTGRRPPRVITKFDLDTYIAPNAVLGSGAVSKKDGKSKTETRKKPLPEDCHVTPKVKAFMTCTYGPPKPTYHVALTGDSHMLQYQGPILALAKKYRWSLTFVAKSACPIADPALYPTNMGNPTCKWWNSKREAYFMEHRHFDLVFNSGSSFITHNHENLAASYFSTVKKITDLTSTVLLIRDNPKGIVGVGTCSKNKPKLRSGGCDNTRENALLPLDELPAAVATNDRVIVADFTDASCDETTCFAYRDKKKVYRDTSHISDNWAMHLLSRLDAVIPDQFKKPAVL